MSQDSDFKKSSEKDLKKATMPPLPFAGQMKREEEARESKEKLESIMKKEGPLTIDEARLLLADMKRKQEEMKQKLDEMYAQRGVSPEYLKTYLSNHSNFTPEQWEEIRNKRQAIFDSLNLSSEQQIGKGEASQDSQAAKERRSKVAKGHRRNWLRMR